MTVSLSPLSLVDISYILGLPSLFSYLGRDLLRTIDHTHALSPLSIAHIASSIGVQVTCADRDLGRPIGDGLFLASRYSRTPFKITRHLVPSRRRKVSSLPIIHFKIFQLISLTLYPLRQNYPQSQLPNTRLL